LKALRLANVGLAALRDLLEAANKPEILGQALLFVVVALDGNVGGNYRQ
jgi:hypothetical protein